MIWYPLRSTLVDPTASDLLVVFGRPKGQRGSYSGRRRTFRRRSLSCPDGQRFLSSIELDQRAERLAERLWALDISEMKRQTS